MGTVFITLIFIIYFSQGMIWLINRYFPEEPAGSPATGVPNKVAAAISTAVNIASGGKAKVAKIEKIKL